MEQRQSFQQMVLEQLGIHVQKKKKKKKTWHKPYTFHKNYLKMDHKPKHKTQNYKTPRKP